MEELDESTVIIDHPAELAHTQPRIKKWIRTYVPITNWLPHYRREFFLDDLISGVTLATIVVPQGMAYAILTGVPPIYGLYTSIIPPILYTLLGTSEYNNIGTFCLKGTSPGPDQTPHPNIRSIGTFAVVSIMTNQTLTTCLNYITNSPTESLAVSSVLLLTFISGILQLALYIIRAGTILIYLLPEPFTASFSLASSFHVVGSQLKTILGVKAPSGVGIGSLLKTLGNLFSELSRIQVETVLVAVSSIIVIELIPVLERRWRGRRSPIPPSDTQSSSTQKTNPVIPEVLCTVTLFTFLSWALSFAEKGIQVIGQIPGGLMTTSVPWDVLNTINQLWKSSDEAGDKTITGLLLEIAPGLVSTCLVAYVTTYSTAKTFPSQISTHIAQRKAASNNEDSLPSNQTTGARTKTKATNTPDAYIANQELLALSLCTIIASFTSCFIPSASLSRTALLASQTPTKTPITTIICVIIVMGVVLFATSLLSHVPQCVLSAVIVCALKGVFKRWRRPIELWKMAVKDHQWANSQLSIPMSELGQVSKTSRIEPTDQEMLVPATTTEHHCTPSCLIHFLDFIIYAMTFVSVVFSSVELGAAIGMLTSLCVLVVRTTAKRTSSRSK